MFDPHLYVILLLFNNKIIKNNNKYAFTFPLLILVAGKGFFDRQRLQGVQNVSINTAEQFKNITKK